MAYEKSVTKDNDGNDIIRTEWNDKHSVNVPINNNGFNEFIKIIEHAVIAIQHSNDPEKVSDILYEMTMYTQKHFETEDRCMRRFEYAEYELHKKEHSGFIKKTVDYCSMAMRGNYDFIDDLLEYLRQWLTNHVKGSDKRFMDAIKIK